jgi:hypothetical protein
MEKIVILDSAAVSDPNSYIPRSRVDDNEECNSFFFGCICPQVFFVKCVLTVRNHWILGIPFL